MKARVIEGEKGGGLRELTYGEGRAEASSTSQETGYVKRDEMVMVILMGGSVQKLDELARKLSCRPQDIVARALSAFYHLEMRKG